MAKKRTLETRIQERMSAEDQFIIVPKGHRLLIQPLEADQNYSIELLSETLESDKLGNTLGRVLAIGEQAWKDLGGSEIEFSDVADHTFRVKNGPPWAAVGDIVLFQRYSGMRVLDPMSLKYRDDRVIVNDQDIVAVVHGFDEYSKKYNKAKDEVLAEIREEQEELRRKVATKF